VTHPSDVNCRTTYNKPVPVSAKLGAPRGIGTHAQKRWPLSFSTADRDQDNSANQADSAHDGREIDSVFFLMRDLERTNLGVFLLFFPAQPAPGKADYADDDENNADDSCGFHGVDATGDVGR
jgi:hypothetical protein